MTFKLIKGSVFFLIFSICLVSSFALLRDNYKSILAEKTIKVNNTDSCKTVVIDAGHGGIDGGTVGINGAIEKDIDLAIAQKLGKLLKLSGYNVIFTREDDTLLGDGEKGNVKLSDLRSRVEIANSNPNAVFISIHANANPIQSCNGMQIYYSKNNSKSETIASLICTYNKEYIDPDNKREIKCADSSIYILNQSNIPSVLVECGFLSNPKEAALLCDDDYQKKICTIIASSITEYTR